MGFKTADRVLDTTTSTGVGTITLANSAPTGYRTFGSAIQLGEVCCYCIVGGAEWEVGLGTLATSTRLKRNRVLASSNSGSRVNFASGTKSVFVSHSGHREFGGPAFLATLTRTIANTVTETTLFGTEGSGSLGFAAGSFFLGRTIRIRLSGFISCTLSPPTLNVQVKLGSTVICSTGAVTLPASLSNTGWAFEAELTFRDTETDTGTGTIEGDTVIGQGRLLTTTPASLAAFAAFAVATADVSVNLSSLLALAVTATWGTAAAGNTLSCTNAVVEVLN